MGSFLKYEKDFPDTNHHARDTLNTGYELSAGTRARSVPYRQNGLRTRPHGRAV